LGSGRRSKLKVQSSKLKGRTKAQGPRDRVAPRSAGLRPGANARRTKTRRIGDRRSASSGFMRNGNEIIPPHASRVGNSFRVARIWSAGTCHRFAQATCRRRSSRWFGNTRAHHRWREPRSH
jgi:hypothetical protein